MENKKTQMNIFGKPVIKNDLLRNKFIEPPFSVLDTKQGNWQKRKRAWKSLGLKSDVGSRIVKGNNALGSLTNRKNPPTESMKKILGSGDGVTFDPALCEVLYNWFCPDNGHILDPFAGGSVRGIVANYLNYHYTGIDVRQEQIDSNREQSLDILPINNQPNYYVGDANEILDDKWNKKFNLIFSCPPYANLEKYSDLDGDISNMRYTDFLAAYQSIIKKSCDLLKKDGYAIFVVGEIRDKKGNYIGFVPDTIRAFQNAGMCFYNDAILLNPIASASMRANNTMKNKKLVKVHQNILIFRKGEMHA